MCIALIFFFFFFALLRDKVVRLNILVFNLKASSNKDANEWESGQR